MSDTFDHELDAYESRLSEQINFIEREKKMAESLFKKAVRAGIPIKIALIGPSGSGKTFTALTLASGMSKGSEIAVIDTECMRALHYADKFDFLHLHFDAPFAPERYVKAINIAEAEGIKTLIIDSASHEWMGKGGCLEIHSKMEGNSYTAWAKITPRHNDFIQTIVNSKMNIICCLRGKDDYVIEEDKNGKKVPRKIGMGAEQRSGMEYEMTCSFNLDMEHVAKCTKDTTGVFTNHDIKVLTAEDGVRLAKWSNKTEEKTEEKKEEVKA